MTFLSERDITRLQREDLLEDYWAISQRRRGALVNTALRTRSVSMRDILVYGATKVTNSSEELKRLILEGVLTLEDISDYEALGELGRLVLLQNILNDDIEYADALFRFAIRASPKKKLSRKNNLAFTQYLIATGKLHEARVWLDRFPETDTDYFEYLKAEILNPFSHGSEETTQEWLEYFNRMFISNDVAPISVEKSAAPPFDRVKCERGTTILDGRLVSVVLTSFQPDETALRTSVNSILNQTWSNLELIIVDDCSGPDYRELFDSISVLDPRIRIIHLTENRGTYVARNIGNAETNGEFITGQDDDDWSHPERIAEQVRYLDENPHDIGCRVTAVRCDENLGRVRIGYSPLGENASSLLFRREGYEAVDTYLSARKGADTEYHFRMEKVMKRKVGRVRIPLSIIRIMEDSLSRGDFSPGWKHTSRRSFRSSYEYWHRTAPLQELRAWSGGHPRVKVPRRFRSSIEASDSIDVVFAGNWEKFGGPQKSMLEEIHAMVKAGYRVGIINFEAARFMNNRFQNPLASEIQGLINAGYVDEVHFDDHLNVKLLLLRYPPILQFFTHDVTNLSIAKFGIVANQAPSEMNGQDIRYRVEDCHFTAKRAFKVEPIWIPQGPQVRRFLEHYLEPKSVADCDLPGVLDIQSWWRDRFGPRSLSPVVGRHSRDDTMKWPDDGAVVRELYRTDGSYDVRILGGAETPLSLLDDSLLSTGWTVYDNNEIPVKNFLHSLDFYVFFQHAQAVEAFGRVILEALASGLVVILPRSFQDVFGQAAIYAEPEEVSSLIFEYSSDFALYKKQVQTSRRILESDFSYRSCVERIERLMIDIQGVEAR